MDLIRTNFLAIRDFFSAWKKLVYIGPIAVAGSLIAFVIYYALFTVFFVPVFDKISPALPFAVEDYNLFLLGLLLPIGFSIRLGTMIWIRADSVLYTEDRSRWIAEFGQSVMIAGQMIIYFVGMGIIYWVLDYAVASRITAIQPFLPLIMIVLFAPLWSRLWLFPATGAVEGENTSGVWNALCTATKGHNLRILGAVAVQAIPLAILGFYLLSYDWATFADAFKNFRSMRPEVLGEILKATPGMPVLVLVVFGGFYLSVLGVMQVETVRYFMAAPTTGDVDIADEDDESGYQTLAEALASNESVEAPKMMEPEPEEDRRVVLEPSQGEEHGETPPAGIEKPKLFGQ